MSEDPSQRRAAGERLLVCVSARPASASLVQAAAATAAALGTPWYAVHVERGLFTTAEERERVGQHLRLAQTLGAETLTLASADPIADILAFAAKRNVTRILVGRPTRGPVWTVLSRPFFDELARRARGVRIEIAGEDDRVETTKRTLLQAHAHAPATAWLAALVMPVVASVVALILGRAELADIVMVYLAGVVVVAMRWPVAPALATAALSVIAFDYFFVPPLHQLGFADPRHTVTVMVMFVVAATISVLAQRSRAQAEASRQREARTSSLYALTRALAAAKTEPEVAAAARMHLAESFGARVEIQLDIRPPTPPGSRQVELHGSQGDLGAILLRESGDPSVDAEETVLLRAFAVPIAASLDRAHIAEVARLARLRAETEQMRNALLSSVSHDLRTPLAVITGAATTLLEGKVDATTGRELTEEIVLEAERLHRLVRNLLDMTRLEAGVLEAKKEWQPLEEVVGTALERLSRVVAGRQVDVALAEDLGLVPFDSLLVEQVLVNLLENAARYTPKDAAIRISAERHDGEVELVVADRGPGIPRGAEERVFERFQRASSVTGGTGLGLAICRGVIALHGGRIWAESPPGGGAAIHFTLPIEGEPPPISAAENDPDPPGTAQELSV